MLGRIAFFTNTSWNFVNFRLEMARYFVTKGYEVVVISPDDSYQAQIEKEFVFFKLEVSRFGIGFWSFFEKRKAFKKLIENQSVDSVVCVGLIVSLFVCLAFLVHRKIKIFPVITGIGILERSSFLPVILTVLSVPLSRGNTVFVQNPEDFQFFKKLLFWRSVVQMHGSGIPSRGDLETSHDLIAMSLEVVWAGRLLRSKGIMSLLEVADLIAEDPDCRDIKLVIFGREDLHHPDALSGNDIVRLESHPKIRVERNVRDVQQRLASCLCAIVPTSYGEGVPRFLLEALSNGKIIISKEFRGSSTILNELPFYGLYNTAEQAKELIKDVARLDHDVYRELAEETLIVFDSKYRDDVVHEMFVRHL